MKAICITGTPASGKTTLAKDLAKTLKHQYLSVNEIIDKHKEVIDSYNKTLDTKEIDTEKLIPLLTKKIKNSKKPLVIDSHLSHLIPKTHIKLCIVTKCDLKELKKRLKKRKYSDKKIKENLESEIFETCLIEALEKKHKILIIDTTNGYDIATIKNAC
jgi:adenylate kinase